MDRVGLGFDVHAFAPDRRLVLGGVEIPFTHGLAGHSDADVVLHAVMDALLGALALGDIGQHFPNTDERYRNADSKLLCEQVYAMIRSRGYQVGNIDVMIMAEQPKIAPHTTAMRACIAELVGCTMDAVSVKATTMEKMGFVGRREGIAAQAVVLLTPSGKDVHQ
ncbi:2-C-methyl-D-erythritol 2,4-cyclodiphosphate synthase [Alicyclobacillus contaminans]|uniref:2-C-methyl-D-erythritol 2,4-cyclodiphosphate synthase n=1 Tax=Alicyclobacillus contaminans TaxID=392016 RepID=UPI0003F6E2BC|nr:2-C-methyl-D-erythritol 2,4-cyclodiphosphate synthase [Alicyclobacillus contaminans]GMA50486.1 2-C-methyl-D-erythritol 2,4-cyclodiphosphate synthase [Alicyclobacillus contaminans]